MTPKDKAFQFRLTEEELQKLEEEAKKAGFLNTSDFVRYMTIGEGRSMQADLKKILEKLDKK